MENAPSAHNKKFCSDGFRLRPSSLFLRLPSHKRKTLRLPRLTQMNKKSALDPPKILGHVWDWIDSGRRMIEFLCESVGKLVFFSATCAENSWRTDPEEMVPHRPHPVLPGPICWNAWECSQMRFQTTCKSVHGERTFANPITNAHEIGPRFPNDAAVKTKGWKPEWKQTNSDPSLLLFQGGRIQEFLDIHESLFCALRSETIETVPVHEMGAIHVRIVRWWVISWRDFTRDPALHCWWLLVLGATSRLCFVSLYNRINCVWLRNSKTSITFGFWWKGKCLWEIYSSILILCLPVVKGRGCLGKTPHRCGSLWHFQCLLESSDRVCVLCWRRFPASLLKVSPYLRRLHHTEDAQRLEGSTTIFFSQFEHYELWSSNYLPPFNPLILSSDIVH